LQTEDNILKAKREMLSPFDIACFAHKMQNQHNLPISDLAETIYRQYLVSVYSDLTLIQLMDAIHSQCIVIKCELNKSSLIQLIIENDIPICIDKYDNYNTQYFMENGNLWIEDNLQCFKISKGDVFKFGQKSTTFCEIDQNRLITLKDNKNKTSMKVPVNSFIEKLNSDNTTYERCIFFKNKQNIITFSAKCRYL